LAETYKVPELKFDEQASKHHYNYQTWIMCLQPIIAIYPQTAPVLPGDKVIPFVDSHTIGNHVALALIQNQCAHISREDKGYFHETFVALRIRENETASNFLKRFTYAKTTAEAASNEYTTDQLVDYLLAGLRPSKVDVYRTALQLYRLERLQDKKFTLQDIEQNLFQIDEELACDKRKLCTEHAMAVDGTHCRTYRSSTPSRFGGRSRGGGGKHRPRPHKLATAAAVTDTTIGIVCYKCGEPGHKAPSCPQHTGT
jgi:hypothetical protein